MFTQRHFQFKMNKKTLFEYKWTKEILWDLKELRHDILGHLFDGLNYG